TTSSKAEEAVETLTKKHPSLKDVPAAEEGAPFQYRIIQDTVKDTSFYSCVMKEGLLVLVLNPEHPFYKKVYKPLIENETKENKELRSQIDLLLLGAARAEAAATRDNQRESLAQFRRIWSDNLATFLIG